MMKKLFLNQWMVVVVSLCLLQASCGDMFMDEQSAMRSARAYMENREINSAAIELRNVLQANPEHAEARFLLGMINLEYGDFATAAKEFRRAQASGWDRASVAHGLARSLLGTNDFQGVIEQSESEDAWPASVRAGLLGLRAIAHAGLNDHEQALASLEAARQVDAGSLDVIRTGIQLAIVDGRTGDAIDELERALGLFSGNPDLLLLQAGLQSEKNTVAAEANYRKVVSMDPEGFISANGRMARLQLVQLLILAGKFDQAAEILQPLHRRDRNDPFTNYLGGVIAFQRGDNRRAEELFLKVLKLAPDHNPTRLLFGTVNYAEDNYEQAAYFLSKYLVAVPDNLVARKLLARSYILLGRNEDAGRILQDALVRETNDAELLALAAMSDLYLGRTAAGIAGLEQAVKVDPESAVLRNELAKAYIEAGESGLAINELRGLLARGGRQQQTEALLVLAHLRAGEHSEAINLVLDMVSRSPADAAVLTLAGNVFAASGDLQEARSYLEGVAGREAEFLPAILSLARIEEQEENYARAAGLYEQLVDSGSPSVIPYLALARVGEKRGDHDALLGWLQRAQEHDPNDIRPRMYLAEYHLRKGEPAIARTHVKGALELFPDKPELLTLSGRIYLAEKDYRKALQPLQALVRTEPGSVTAHILLGESYLQLGQIDEARREVMAVLNQRLDDSSALAFLARLEIKAGNLQQALAYSRQHQQASPKAFLGYELAGDSLMGSKLFVEAEREYAQAWERQPSSRLVIKRAENASRSGSPDKAIAGLEDWLRSHPDDIQVAEFLGTSLQQTGNKTRAIEIYDKVIAADPDNAVALNNLAGLYLAEDRPESLELAERAWQVSKENPGVQDTYGWALVKNGQVGRGLQLLERAVKSLPDIPEVRYHHAVALYGVGKKDAAQESLRELLDKDLKFEGRDDAERLLQEWLEHAETGVLPPDTGSSYGAAQADFCIV